MDYLTIYRDRLVWTFPPNFQAQGIDHGQLDDFSYNAPTGGAAVPWKVTPGPKRTLTLPFLIETYDSTRTSFRAFRAWWATREGRRKAFWVPTWLTDYVIVQDYAAGALTIRVKWVGVGTKLAFGAQFRHLAIIDRFGKMEFYRIDASATVGDFEDLTLDHVLETAIDASESICCGLLYARLAEDEIEYEYQSAGVAHVELRFVELPKETEGADNDGSKPIFLYIIQQGATVWRFTNYPISLTIGGNLFNASALEHGTLSEDIEFSSDSFTLSLLTDDLTHPVCQFLDPAFIQLSTLLIYETDAEAPALGTPIYKGRVEGAAFRDKGMIDVRCSTLMRVAEIEIPQALSERTCVHQTYDGYCGVNAAAFTTAGTITAKSSSPPYVEAAEFGAKATAEGDPDWFSLGLVTVGSEQRFCTKQDGNRLYLNAPFRAALVGDSISALAGDDKRIETCDGKFNNVTANAKGFLGFPWMPNKNPQFEALETPKPKGGKK